MHALAELFGSFSLYFFLAFDRQVEHLECVFNKIEFDLFVERTVGAETRQVVHFNEPWFQLAVDHHIKTDYLEAQLIL